MNSPVEAVIGLGLEVKGQAWDKLHSQLDRHVKDWNAVEGHVNRIGSHVESLAGRLIQLGGAVGVGALINDFVKLEGVANRAALAVGNVTGNSGGYRPIAQQLLGAGAATGFYGGELGQAITDLQNRAGGSYLARPGAIPGVARSLGTFAGAYSVDPSALAQQIGGIELFQRQNPGSTPLLLKQMAAQASHAGMAGQTGLFTQNVSSVVQSLISQHPASAGPGANIRVGAMYGAAQLVNPAFRDAGVFGQAVGGVDSAITGAYQNPRLQAVMQMAGIGYWDQRGGLAGPHGPQMARKLLAWSAAQYGQGSVAQDMFLRSNFGGNVSADFLQSLSSGKGAAAQRSITDAATNPSALSSAAAAMQQRSDQYRSTPEATLNQGRNAIEREVYGLFGGAGLDVAHFIAAHPLESIAGAYGLKRGLPTLGRRAGGFALRRAQLFAAQQVARALTGAAVGGAGAAGMEAIAGAASGVLPDAFMGGAFSGSGAGAAGGGGSLAGRALGFGGSLAAGTAAAYAGFMLFPDSTQSAAYDHRGPGIAARNSRAHVEHGIASDLARKYGNDWWTKPEALGAMDRMIRHRGGDPHERRIMEKQLRAAISRQAGHTARAMRQGPLGDFFSTALGGVPGIGPGLSGLFDLGAQMYSKGHPGHDAGADLLGLFNHRGGKPGGASGASTRRFDHAVDKFGRIVAAMGLGSPFGTKGAAFSGPGPGMMNAGGLMGGNDAVGATMVLARAIGGGGGGGGGGGTSDLQYAALGVGGGGGGGTDPVGGGGWKPCELTWYDPALGGTNSGNGRKDPHHPTASGEPYSATAFTCAAPSSYSFGTMIAFKYGGKTVTCKVNDRGGAITGDHFDLSRGAARALGVISAGRARAKFKVVGHGGGKRGGRHDRRAAAGDGSGSASDAIQAAIAWQTGGGAGSAGGAGGAGGGGGGHGGGGNHVTVNVDGRKIEHYQALTRRPV